MATCGRSDSDDLHTGKWSVHLFSAHVYHLFCLQVNFFCFLVADIFLLLCINLPQVFGEKDKLSTSFRLYLESAQTVALPRVLLGLLVARLLIRFIWLLLSPLLLVAMRDEYYFINHVFTVYAWPWLKVSMVSLVYSSGLAIFYLAYYFQPGFLRNFGKWFGEMQTASPSSSSADEAVHFTLFLTLLDGVAIFYVISLAVTVAVHRVLRHLPVFEPMTINSDFMSNMDVTWPTVLAAQVNIPRPKLMRPQPESLNLTKLDAPPVDESIKQICNSSNCAGNCSELMSRSISRIHSVNSPSCAYENRAFSTIEESIEMSPYNQAPCQSHDYRPEEGAVNRQSRLTTSQGVSNANEQFQQSYLHGRPEHL